MMPGMQQGAGPPQERQLRSPAQPGIDQRRLPRVWWPASQGSEIAQDDYLQL